MSHTVHLLDRLGFIKVKNFVDILLSSNILIKIELNANQNIKIDYCIQQFFKNYSTVIFKKI